MSPQSDVFYHSIDLFAAEQEEIKATAAFAAGASPFLLSRFQGLTASFYLGNIAIGNLHQFLPAIIKLMESDNKKRLLALHASKEVSTYIYAPLEEAHL